MTTEVPDTGEQWTQFVDDLLLDIKAGFLDPELKKIATACMERNGRLKNGAATPDRNEAFPFEKTASASAEAELQKVKEELARLKSGQNTPAPNTNKKAPPQKRTMRRPKNNPTFRFTDGYLYNRGDLIGKTKWHHNINGEDIYVRITGIGVKAIKVEFVTAKNGLVTNSDYVPVKYRDKDAKYGIKDPIFMGLDFVKDLVDQLTPIAED